MRLCRLSFAFVLVAAVHLLGASPASACSCGPVTEAQAATGATAVFAGKLVAATLVPADLPESEALALTFEVDSVYKGDIAARQDVVDALPNGQCGPAVGPVGATYLVFTHASVRYPGYSGVPGWSMYTGSCGGNRLLSVTPVSPELGTGRPPPAGTVSTAIVVVPSAAVSSPTPRSLEAPHSAGSSPSAPAPAPTTASGPAQRSGRAAYAVVGLLLVAAIAAGLAIRIRRGAAAR